MSSHPQDRQCLHWGDISIQGDEPGCRGCVPCNCRLPRSGEPGFSQHLNTVICLAAALRLETRTMVELQKQS